MLIIINGVGLIVVGGLLVKTILKIRKLNKIDNGVDEYINILDDVKKLPYKDVKLLLDYNNRCLKEVDKEE